MRVKRGGLSPGSYLNIRVITGRTLTRKSVQNLIDFCQRPGYRDVGIQMATEP